MNYKSILKVVGIAVFAAFLCVGCSNNSTGGGGKEEPASTYIITFDPNGGYVTPGGDTTGADGTLASLPTPTRGLYVVDYGLKSYTFNGWFTETTGGELVTESTVFNKNAIIYAQWTFTPYKVAFDANGGTVTPDSGTVIEGWKIDSLPTPIRDGYNFKGWFSADTGGRVITEDSLVRSITLYAQWTLKTYTITLDANGGILTGAQNSLTTGAGWKLASLPTPVKSVKVNNFGKTAYYTFNGWFTEATGGEAVTDSTVFSNDATIYAQWTFNTYKIALDANGGTVTPDSGTIVDGLKFESLPTPERDGYIFNGWFTAATDGKAVTEDSVFTGNKVYAQWTLKTYTITLDANGGTRPSWATNSLTTGAGWTLGARLTSVNAPTRYGYTFSGWFSAATGGERVTVSTVFYKDTTIYAGWALNTYTVNFSGNDYDWSWVPQNIQHGGKLTEPEATTRTGYTFGGWYSGGTQWNFDTDTVTSAMTLYARWNIIQYTITFDANGGTVSSESGTTGEGWKLTSLPTPTKDGYGCSGWFTERTGGTKITTSTAFSENTTIYAQWFISYTITFNTNGGEITQETGMTDIEGKLVLLTPTKSGYFFNCWYTEETGGTKVTASTTFSAATTIYAQWVETIFTDSRNGATSYPVVQIGTQVWMAKNLNYDVPDVTTDVCSGNSADSCAKYGRKYDWSTAMTACPVGWHLPSDAEWNILVNYAGGSSTAGTKLKSSTGWSLPEIFLRGTNEYGFSAIPECCAGSYGWWWTATEVSGVALMRGIGHDTERVIEGNALKSELLSVRCVHD